MLAAVSLMLVAGCASRSLNAPPVEDWSGGAPAVGRPANVPATVPQYYTVKRDDTLATIAKRYNTTPADLANWNNLGPNPRVKADQILRVNAPTPPAPSPVDVAPVAVPQAVGSGAVEQRPLGSPPEGPSTPLSSTPLPPTPTPSSAPLKAGPPGLKRPFSDAILAEMSRPDGDAPGVAPPAAAAGPSTSVPPAAIVPATGNATWAWPAGGKPASGFGDGKTKGIDIPGKAGDPVLAAGDGKVTFAGAGVRGYGNFVIIRHTPELLSVYAHNRANLVKEGAVVTKGQKIAEMGASDTDSVKLHFEIRNDSKPVDPLKYLPER